MNTVIMAVVVLGVIAAIFGLILAYASKVFAVEKDPREEAIAGCLPGANCGACGYAGCADYAKAIVEEGAPVNKCVPGGANCAAAVAAVMGVEAGATASVKATVRCQGKPGVCTQLFDYQGVASCAAAAALHGGSKACAYGCLGLGDCVKACKFDAIHVVDGIAHVDPEKCTGCGACAAACPKSVIEMASDMDSKPLVLCHNTEKGPVVMKECQTGCIGCMKCQKTCPSEAIKVENFLASIDYSKCTGCGQCVEVCPKHVIVRA